MRKKSFFSVGVMVALIVAIVAIAAVIFGCTPRDGGSSGSSVSLPGSSAGAGSASVADAPPPVLDEWEIPTIVPITGSERNIGLAAAWGFDYGVKVVNELGGVRGRPVKITTLDAASSGSEVITEIGTAASDALAVMAPPTEELYKAGEQTFYTSGMAAVGAAVDIKNREAYKPFAISCISDMDDASKTVAETWQKSVEPERVCMFFSAANTRRAAAMEEAFKAASVEVVDKIELGGDEFDAAGLVERAFVADADAYYIDAGGEDTLSIVAQLRVRTGISANTLKILCGPSAAYTALLDSADGSSMLGFSVWSPYDPGKASERRDAFNEAFDKNVGDPALYSIAVDYYQSALLFKQAIETLGLEGEDGALLDERVKLAEYLYDAGLVSTDHGDFIMAAGEKQMAAGVYKVTENGFEAVQ